MTVHRHKALVRVMTLACAVVPTLAFPVPAKPVNTPGVEIEIKSSATTETAATSSTLAATEGTSSTVGETSATAPSHADSHEALQTAIKKVAVPEGGETSVTTEKPNTPDAVVTESLAIKSGGDLLVKLNIVAPRKITPDSERESAETTPTQLIDTTQFERLLGQKPTVLYQVVYQGIALPDPMVIPWIKNEKVLRERFEDAVQMLAEQKIPQAKDALQAIESDFPESEPAKQAREILKKLEDYRKTTAQAPKPGAKVVGTPAPAEPQPSVNLHIGSAVVVPGKPEDSMVMINQRGYKAGEVVRGLENHKVVRIGENSVTIEVEEKGRTKQFEFSLRQR